MTRKEQFEYIEFARQSVLGWTGARGIPLARVEFVVPFVHADFSLSTWLFYKTDHDVFYLHGALPFFDSGVAVVNEEYDIYNYLLQKIDARMEKGEYPIFGNDIPGTPV